MCVPLSRAVTAFILTPQPSTPLSSRPLRVVCESYVLTCVRPAAPERGHAATRVHSLSNSSSVEDLEPAPSTDTDLPVAVVFAVSLDYGHPLAYKDFNKIWVRLV